MQWVFMEIRCPSCNALNPPGTERCSCGEMLQEHKGVRQFPRAVLSGLVSLLALFVSMACLVGALQDRENEIGVTIAVAVSGLAALAAGMLLGLKALRDLGGLARPIRGTLALVYIFLVLVLLVFGIYFHRSEMHEKTLCWEQLYELARAVQALEQKTGTRPSNLEEISPAAIPSIPSCPTGATYRYERKGNGFEISCPGDHMGYEEGWPRLQVIGTYLLPTPAER